MDTRGELLVAMIRDCFLRSHPRKLLLGALCGDSYSADDETILDAYVTERSRNLASALLLILEETAKRHDGVIPGLDSEEVPR